MQQQETVEKLKKRRKETRGCTTLATEDNAVSKRDIRTVAVWSSTANLRFDFTVATASNSSSFFLQARIRVTQTSTSTEPNRESTLIA